MGPPITFNRHRFTVHLISRYGGMPGTRGPQFALDWANYKQIRGVWFVAVRSLTESDGKMRGSGGNFVPEVGPVAGALNLTWESLIASVLICETYEYIEEEHVCYFPKKRR